MTGGSSPRPGPGVPAGEPDRQEPSDEPNLPFRWDLARREQLGRLVEGRDGHQSDLTGLEECAAKVLARSDDADMWFVGRSADSVFDYLSGALLGTSYADRLHLLPFSLRWGRGDLTPYQVKRFRINLRSLGLDPDRLARRRRPVAFVDLVDRGGTYGNLFALLREWIDDEGAQWDVIRLKLRFVGIVWRSGRGFKTERWHQQAGWTAQLPPRAVVNVSVDYGLASMLAGWQAKATSSFTPDDWVRPVRPGRATATGSSTPWPRRCGCSTTAATRPSATPWFGGWPPSPRSRTPGCAPSPWSCAPSRGGTRC